MVLFSILNVVSVIKSVIICENAGKSYTDNRNMIFLKFLPKHLGLYFKNLSGLTNLQNVSSNYVEKVSYISTFLKRMSWQI